MRHNRKITIAVAVTSFFILPTNEFIHAQNRNSTTTSGTVQKGAEKAPPPKSLQPGISRTEQELQRINRLINETNEEISKSFIKLGLDLAGDVAPTKIGDSVKVIKTFLSTYEGTNAAKDGNYWLALSKATEAAARIATSHPVLGKYPQAKVLKYSMKSLSFSMKAYEQHRLWQQLGNLVQTQNKLAKTLSKLQEIEQANQARLANSQVARSGIRTPATRPRQTKPVPPQPGDKDHGVPGMFACKCPDKHASLVSRVGEPSGALWVNGKLYHTLGFKEDCKNEPKQAKKSSNNSFIQEWECFGVKSIDAEGEVIPRIDEGQWEETIYRYDENHIYRNFHFGQSGKCARVYVGTGPATFQANCGIGEFLLTWKYNPDNSAGRYVFFKSKMEITNGKLFMEDVETNLGPPDLNLRPYITKWVISCKPQLGWEKTKYVAEVTSPTT